MASQRRFCPTCAAVRPAVRYSCALCGTPVRLDVRPYGKASRSDANTDPFAGSNHLGQERLAA
jgi:predicted amidophosphoribosyltransferase